MITFMFTPREGTLIVQRMRTDLGDNLEVPITLYVPRHEAGAEGLDELQARITEAVREMVGKLNEGN